MRSDWRETLSESPRIRRKVMKVWRALLRLERATLAYGILVLRRNDDRLLLLQSPTGESHLPFKELEGWSPIPDQIEDWLAELRPKEALKPKLVCVDGTPDHDGVCFVYTASIQDDTREGGELWLSPHEAASILGERERRLFQRCANIPSSSL
jgi:hypothetical protein